MAPVVVGRRGPRGYRRLRSIFSSTCESAASASSGRTYALSVLANAEAHEAAFGGYRHSGFGREARKMILDHYQQTKNLPGSYSPNALGLF